jgi:hypothetical protein
MMMPKPPSPPEWTVSKTVRLSRRFAVERQYSGFWSSISEVRNGSPPSGSKEWRASSLRVMMIKEMSTCVI